MLNLPWKNPNCKYKSKFVRKKDRGQKDGGAKERERKSK